MKTNEIPEKIVQDGIEYYRVDTIEELTYDKETFVRKDILIEKVCSWLKEIFSEYENLTDYNSTEDFKNYMKGE